MKYVEFFIRIAYNIMLRRLQIRLEIISLGLSQGERASGVQNIFCLKS